MDQGGLTFSQASTKNTWSDRLYLSTDTTISADDIIILTQTNNVAQQSIQLTIPPLPILLG